MKKLLSILVCFFLSLGSLWAQAGSATINAYAVCDDDGDGVYTQGGGTVQASAVQYNWGTVSFKKSNVNGSVSMSSSAVGKGGYHNGIFKTYTEAYYVQATRKSTTQNYYFEGWYSGTAQGPNLSSSLGTGDTHKKDYAYNASGDLYVYAVFKKIINPRQSSISWTKTTETATLETEVALYEATNFQVASITYNGTGTVPTSFTCTPSSTTTSDGTIELTLSAGEDVKDGDKFTITLTSDNDGFATITVDILTTIQVQFAPPAKGKGSYKAVRTNGDGVTTCTLDQNSSAETVILNEISKFYHTLTATPADGYQFYRWVIEDASGKTTYSMTNPYGYTVKNGDRISVEFLPEGVAQFIVKGEDGVYYYELDAAIAAAQNSTSKTVVVSESGLLSLENKTVNSDGKYEFTIPAGITLLVPGDAAYTVRNNGITDDDISPEQIPSGGFATSTCFRNLTLQPNISIIANGNICVYSKLSGSQNYNGQPYQYGQIEMQNGSQITMKSGSVLTVFGYISGDPENSSVVVEDGATVYEVFQITDFRGGTATSSAYNNGDKIFPLGQYYVQNIETKLILKYGAVEKVSCVVLEVLNMTFISKDTGSNDDQGFLCLGQGTQLEKSYDSENDRLKFVIEGDENASNTSTAKLSYMYLNLGKILVLFDVIIDSRNYILPVNNNIDISINNLRLNCPNDMVFMAGSTLTINETAEVDINSGKSVYIYDTEQNTGFYSTGGTTNYKIKPINYTTVDGYDVKNKRKDTDVVDAKFLVNGKLIVNGALYTTTYGSDITDADIKNKGYGANITSTEGGEVYFANIGSATQIKQYKQNDTQLSTVSIPVTNARLRNNDQSFSAGENADVGDRYIYYTDVDGGKWMLPIAAVSQVTLPTLSVTLPTQDNPSGDIVCVVTKPDNVRNYMAEDFEIENANATLFTLGVHRINEDGKLIIPITYNKQSIHSDEDITDTITIKVTENAVVSLPDKVITVSATEKYIPDFSVSATELAFDPIYVNGSAEKALAIGPSANNVTTLDNANMLWTSSISGANSSEFAFTFGDGDQKLSGGKVIYTPTSSGKKSATLTLTATYTDENGKQQSKSVKVSLTAIANLNLNNLAFAEEFPKEIIAGVTGKFPLFEAGTNNAGTTITTELSGTGVIEIIKENGVDYVNVLSAGTVTIKATQEASTTIAGKEISKTITVKSKDAVLSRVPLCIDTKDKFNIHTVSANAVNYSNNNTIDFASTETTSSEWVFQFLGIPDKLVFTPTGGNNWNIEERASIKESWSPVVNWTTFTSGKQVSISLKPTTRQLRIQYGAGEAGSITGLCVSAFTIKSDVDNIYLPVNGTFKEVKFIHTAAPLTISDVDGVTAIISSTENKGTNEEPYYETTVKLTATKADKNVTLIASVTDANSSVHTKAIEIRTYAFPQELPIKLGEDNVERYHFVTTASAHARWDAINRQIVFQNPGALLTRYVTFAFNGAPSEIRFTTSADVRSSDWVIKESVDGVTFTEASIDKRKVEGTSFMQGLDYRTRYLSIEYKSDNLSEVALSDLVIEGFPMAWATPEQLSLNETQTTVSFVLTTVNLQDIKVVLNSTDFAMTHGSSTEEKTLITLSSTNYPNALGVNKVGNITFNVIWKSTGNVNQGLISVYNAANNKLLTTVKILGAKNVITKDDDDVSTGIYTGIATDYTSSFGSEYGRHEVSLENAFDENGKALFDYLIIYGETKTNDGTTEITTPTSSIGSNAVTPYYIYRKAQSSETSGYDSYRFVQLVENANTSNKTAIPGFTTTDAGESPSIYIDIEGSLKVYMTGFCPYATTGQDKAQEGVWFFRGENGETLDIYLEDCHIYSRNKTESGKTMSKEDKSAPFFGDEYARGSGGVLVFENTERWDNSSTKTPFVVNVHTIGHNTLKSNFGCFFSLFNDLMRAYQISAPLHIHMNSRYHVHDSRTELTMDDVWPTELNESGAVSASIRTNGFLSLRKQSNNAPSIDLGSPHSVVNFKGGQVELENAQIVSPNYKTTLAISYRSGEFGGDNVGIKLAYGIGTDSVGGTVNFYDGTTTVLPMEVDAKYRQYYLMDTEVVKDEKGNDVVKELTTTSCLRCPRNTIVHGGSQCFMRACSHVTSKGGAPKDWMGNLLGQYVYGQRESETYTTNERGLVTSMQFPGCVSGLSEYYGETNPRWNSITPLDGKLYFWIPDGYGGVDAEEDKKLTAWKACMTEIESGYEHLSGSIGGDTYIDPTGEEVANFLYCQIDQNIHDVITAGGTEDEYGNVENSTYLAPVKVPKAAQGLAEGTYMTLSPTFVGKDLAYQVETESEYTITDKVYYITTATADVWMTFTAPFDVARIWVVETYDEATLEQTPIKTVIEEDETVTLTKRESVLLAQAKHNADFAAFFGVAMALGSTDDFETIFNDWKEWGIAKDKEAPEGGGTPLYSGTGKYTLRGKYELKPYNGSNWNEANFYLNHNNGSWGYSYTPATEEKEAIEVFTPQWETPTATDGVLLRQGETYSMLFPYCVGCWEEDRTNNTLDREYWDYWSGKFLIFESTDGIVEDENGIVVKRSPHKIKGEEYLTTEVFAGEESLQGQAYLRGNSTFAFLETTKPNVLSYMPYIGGKETFVSEGSSAREILPTQSFLLIPPTMEQQILSVSRTGQIKYRPTSEGSDDTTGGHVPTVGDGSDIFVTATAEGIRVAVEEPQYVGVFAANGALIFNGWVDNSVDVALVNRSVYVVVGENNSVKVVY